MQRPIGAGRTHAAAATCGAVATAVNQQLNGEDGARVSTSGVWGTYRSRQRRRGVVGVDRRRGPVAAQLGHRGGGAAEKAGRGE